MPNILLAESKPHLISALQLMIEQKLGWSVCGVASDVLTLLSLAGESCPDVILLDTGLPGLATWNSKPTIQHIEELVRLIARLCPRARLVALCFSPEARQAVLSAGAHAFASHTDSFEMLLEALSNALEKPHPCCLCTEGDVPDSKVIPRDRE